jgi:hypothetical protein
MIIRKEVFEELRAFEEDFFGSFEDDHPCMEGMDCGLQDDVCL